MFWTRLLNWPYTDHFHAPIISHILQILCLKSIKHRIHQYHSSFPYQNISDIDKRTYMVRSFYKKDQTNIYKAVGSSAFLGPLNHLPCPCIMPAEPGGGLWLGCLKRWLLGCVGGGLEGWIRNLGVDRRGERYNGDVTFRSIALYHSIKFDVQ